MSSDLQYEQLTTISDLIRRKKLSSVEATDAKLQRIAKLDGQYHSYATVLTERALTRAKAADAEIARGLWRGPLHGVPIAVKDLCYTTFAPTSAGATIFKRFVPSFNATVVERLEGAGASLLGKLQMTEGAYTPHHPHVAAPLNPWNTNYGWAPLRPDLAPRHRWGFATAAWAAIREDRSGFPPPPVALRASSRRGAGSAATAFFR